MDPRQLHRRMFEAARELIPAGSCAVVAVSGGPDSMALLHGLAAVNAMRRCDWRLHVGHVDHGLRPDSGDDASFVAAAAASLSLPCTIERADVAETARRTRQTVEEAGRRERYRLLEEIAAACGARIVAVGHQADDQAETVLHRIARGTGLRGLGGMRRRRPIRDGGEIELVRPLLGFRRAELRAYLDQQALACRHDSTNDDPGGATRNLIRQQVLPLLAKSVNPEIATALTRLADQSQGVQEAMSLLAEEALNRLRIRHDEQGVVLSAEGFSILPWAMRTEVVMLVLRKSGVALQAIDFERIKAAAEAADGSKDRPRLIELPGGATVERRGAEVRIAMRKRGEIH